MMGEISTDSTYNLTGIGAGHQSSGEKVISCATEHSYDVDVRVEHFWRRLRRWRAILLD
jgi:hypothetical protein